MSMIATVLAFVPAIAARLRPEPKPDLALEVERLLRRIAKLEVQLCDALNRRDKAEVALERERARQAQERRLEVERLDCQALYQQALYQQQQQAQAGVQQNGLYNALQNAAACQNRLLGAQLLDGLGGGGGAYAAHVNNAEVLCNCVPSRASLLVRGD
jgi:hypothetical protein